MERAASAAHAFAALIVRLRVVIVLGWIAAAVAAAIYLPSPGEASGSALGSFVPLDSPAVLAQRRSAELFDFPVLGNIAVVQRRRAGLTASEQGRVFERARGLAEQRYPELLSIPFGLPVVNTLGVVPGSREDGTTAITFLFVEPTVNLEGRMRVTNWFLDRRVAVEDADTIVGATGVVPARFEEGRLITEALPVVELATVLLIAAVIGLGFRAPLAPVLTLVAVGVAYVVARGAVGFGGKHLFAAEAPQEVEPILLVLLLGLVTDYSIFFLSGVRHRLRDGEAPLEAATGTAADFTPIIATAGLIVAAGAGSLIVARLEFFRVFGPALAVTVLVGLVVSVTFVPAALALLGRAAHWPRHRVRGAAPTVRREPLVVRLIASRRRAAAAAAVCAAAMLAASIPLPDMRLALTPLSGLPSSSEPARAAAAMAEGFAPGMLAPTLLLVEEHTLAGEDAALVRLQRRLVRQPGVAGVIGPGNVPTELPGSLVRSEERTAARFVVVLDEPPFSAAAIDRLTELRAALPRLLTDVGLPIATASVGGNTAIADETIRTIVGDLGRIALAVLAVNLLLLVLFLRSLVAPLFLLAASALAVTATLGVTTFVFQDLLGSDITYYVPFTAAVLLVSLGSDYNVFLVGRIWHEARRRPLREAVLLATPRASRTIAVAAVALALSFALLGLVPLTAFREFAFAMVVGVVLDAFVVRAYLVPALLVLVGPLSAWPGRAGRRPQPSPAGTSGLGGGIPDAAARRPG